MFLLVANYSRGHDNWQITRKFDSLTKAIIMGYIVLAHPWLPEYLYSLSVCDHKGVIIKKFDLSEDFSKHNITLHNENEGEKTNDHTEQ